MFQLYCYNLTTGRVDILKEWDTVEEAADGEHETPRDWIGNFSAGDKSTDHYYDIREV